MKTFDIPTIYRSPLISAIKAKRKENDRLKKDFTPTLLNFGTLQIYLARHFGFCYGVENAIEISFKTIEENKGKRIFLLSEMIHNPQVNENLQAHGLQFLQDTQGKELISFDTLTANDVVIIPAFGTTLAIDKKLRTIGIQIEKYNTTCPFVEKVWNRSEQIAKKNYTIIIHGKPTHEETRATFSHAAFNAPTVIVNNMQEAIELSNYILGKKPANDFYTSFKNQYSEGFDVIKDLQRIGVVNQTTMLASDTQAIADYLKQSMIDKYGINDISNHFADTRDTLCYATNDNQTAVTAMLQTPADIAFVVGGYNSSNTGHLVELCEQQMPTFYIDNANKIVSATAIQHYNLHTATEVNTTNFLPNHHPVKILITSGASCPDSIVEEVIHKLAGFFNVKDKLAEITQSFI